MWNKLDLWIEVNSNCNYKCLFCYNSCKNIVSQSIFDISLIKKVSESAIFKFNNVCLSGGEPLLLENINEVIKEIGNWNVPIQITSNGSIKAENLDFWHKNNVDSIQIHLHSHKPDIHDFLTDSRGSWKRSIETIYYYQCSKIKVVPILIATSHNYRDLLDVIDLCAYLKINTILVNTFLPFKGRGFEHNEKLAISDLDEYYQILKEGFELAKSNGIEMYIGTPFSSKELNSKWIKYTKREEKCNPKIVLDEFGNLRSCIQEDKSICNINQENWEGNIKQSLTLCISNGRECAKYQGL